MYDDIKIFKLYDVKTNKPLYIGSTKARLSNKLAEMKYFYKINNYCRKYRKVFDKIGADNIAIELIDIMNYNDIDEINKKVKELNKELVQPIEQIQPLEQNQPVINQRNYNINKYGNIIQKLF